MIKAFDMNLNFLNFTFKDLKFFKKTAEFLNPSYMYLVSNISHLEMC